MQEVHFIDINHLSHIGEARRLTKYLAGTLGFSEIEKENSAIVVVEAVTNIIKYAKAGKLILTTTKSSSFMKLDMLAIDNGPGLSNINVLMRDGVSTTDTLGIGLGALNRLTTNFDLYSRPQQGSIIWGEIVTIADENSVMPIFPYKIGTVSLPMKHEKYCGDGWGMQFISSTNNWRILISDGLGHGFGAYQATSAAIDIFNKCQKTSLEETLMSIHHALKKTRGAAVALFEINSSKEELYCIGIGNISGKIISTRKNKSIVSTPGIVGHLFHKLNPITYPFQKDDILILSSDGLSNRWSFDEYVGLIYKHPAVMAGVLYRDHHREQDDVTVIAIKHH